MSRNVDERVVSMQFDNKRFESNAKSTMSTLDKLKEKLNFKGASKGLEGLNAAAKKVDMNALGRGVEAVKSKFSALEVMGITALANITNSAVNAGKRIVSALTIDPVRTGFDEYQTKIGAIQTILSNTASKGVKMADVTEVLNELNLYADKTIYNFAEMTKNIGTFTAAGVGLREAASAIQGIANLAASSGSTSQQAATAMYQLSQALAAGTVKLMDWNSVVNAGMGGEKFQNALKATAREYGVAVDEIIKQEGSFRSSLSKGWLSAEILNETLTKFTIDGATKYAKAMQDAGKYTDEQAEALIAEATSMEEAATKVKTLTQLWDTLKESAQSGWAQTWEYIIGNFEQAKAFFSEVSDIIGGAISKAADERNNWLKGALSSNWDKLIDKINEAGVETTEFEEIVKEIAKESSDIDFLIKKFGSIEAIFTKGYLSSDILRKAVGRLNDKFAGLSKLVEGLKIGSRGDDVLSLQKRLKALGYDIGKFGKQADGLDGILGKVTKGALEAFQKASGIKVTGIVDKDTIAAFDKASKSTNKLRGDYQGLIKDITQKSGRELAIDSLLNILKAFLGVIEAVKTAWRNVFPRATAERVHELLERFNEWTKTLEVNEERASQIRRVFEGLFSVLKIFTTFIGSAFSIAFKVISRATNIAGDDVLEFAAKIGDALSGFADWVFKTGIIPRVLGKVIDFISKAVIKIKEWLEYVWQLPAVQETIERFKNAGVDAFNKFKDAIGNFGKYFKDFIDRVKNMEGGFNIQNLLKHIGEVLSDFWNNVVKKAFDFNTIFTRVREAFARLVEDIKKKLGIASDSINNFKDGITSGFERIKEFFANLDMQSLIPYAVAAGVITLTVVIFKLIKSVKGLIIMLKPLAGVLLTLTNYYKSKIALNKAAAWQKRASAILMIAGAVVALAYALKMISEISEADLNRSLIALGIISGILIALLSIMLLIAKFAGTNKVLSVGILIASFGAAILMLAGALAILSSMSSAEIAQGLFVIAGFGAIVMALVGVSAASGKYADLAGRMILSIAGAFLIVGIAIKYIGRIPEESVVKGLFVMIGFGAIVTTMIGISRISGKSADKAGVMIKKFASAMLIVGIALWIAGSLSPQKAFIGVSVMGIFAALVIALIAITKKANSNTVFQASKLISSVGKALLLLAITMRIIGGMDSTAFGQGLSAITVFTLLLGGLIFAASLAGGKNRKNISNLGITMLGVAAALIAMGLAMRIIGSMDTESFAKGLGAISLLMVLIGAVLLASGLSHKAEYTVLAIGVVVLLLVASLKLIAEVDSNKMLKAASSLAIIMLAFGALLAATKYMTKGGNIGKMAATMGIMVGVVALLALVLWGLTSLISDTDSAVKAAVALGIVMLALAGSFAIISKFSSFTSKVDMKGIGKMLLTMLGVMVLAVAGLWALDALIKNPDTLITKVVAVAALMGTMLVLTVAITALGTALGLVGIAGIVAGLAMLAIAIAGITAIVWALGEIAGDPKVISTIEKGGKVLAALGNAIGSFFGSLFEGFAEHAVNGLIKLAMGLSIFWATLQPFLAGMKSLKPEDLEGVKRLAEVIVILTAAELLDSISSFLGGGNGLIDFASQLGTLGGAISEFSNQVVGIDTQKVTAAANAAKMLGELASNVPSDNGVFGSLFGGTMSMDTFGEQLIGFGRAMVTFSNEVDGSIDKSAIELARDCGKMLSNIANGLPTQPGAIGGWFTDHTVSMEEFGNQLRPFGRAMVGFSEIVAGNIDKDAIQNAATAASIISALNLPTQPGWVSGWFNNHEISYDEFGEQIQPFARALVGFSDTVKDGDIDEKAIEVATNAAAVIAGLKLPEKPGVIAAWFNNSQMDYDQFGNQLGPFARGIVRFSNEVQNANISEEATRKATKIAEIVLALQSKLPYVPGQFLQFWGSNQQTIEAFGDNLVYFGRRMAEFSAVVSEEGAIDKDSIKTALEIANSAMDVANNWPKNWDYSSFGRGLDDFATKLVNFSNSLTGKVDLTVLNSTSNSIKKLAEAASLNFTGNDFTDLTTGLDALAASLVEFSNTLSGGDVDYEAISKVAGPMTELAEFAKTAGMVNITTFQGFITNLSNLGSGVVSFTSKIKENYDAEAFTNGFTMIEALTKMVNLVAGVGSSFGYVEDFSEISSKLGHAIFQFCTWAKGTRSAFPNEDIQAFTDAGTKIFTMLGVFNSYASRAHVDDFIATAGDLGGAIVDFFKAVSDDEITIDSNYADLVCSAGTSIIDMYKGITTNSGIDEFISGIKRLGSALYDFGVYCQKIEESGMLGDADAVFSDNGVIGKVVDAIEQLSSVVSRIPDTYKLDTFSTNLGKLGKGLVDFSDKVKGNVDFDKVESAAAAGQDIADMVGNLSGGVYYMGTFNEQLPSLANTLVNFKEKTKSLTSYSFSSLASDFNKMCEKFKEASSTGVKGFISEFNSGTTQSKIRGAVNDMVKASYNAISYSTIAERFKSIGQGVSEGFAIGIRSKVKDVVAAVQSMAKTAEPVARAEIKSESPSKVFIDVGSSIPEGFALGVSRYSYMVSDSVSAMSDDALDGTKLVLSKIADVVNSDIDSQPTIRPVMDLSDVKRGAGMINGMIGTNPTVGSFRNVNSLSSAMNNIQNGSNDLISAVRELGSKLGDTPSNVYNVNGITYDDGSNIASAIRTLTRAAIMERRV